MPFPLTVVVGWEAEMNVVVIGVDPHKRSNTIEVLDRDAAVLAGRFDT